jgi:enterochelin esterase-like enzyme
VRCQRSNSKASFELPNTAARRLQARRCHLQEDDDAVRESHQDRTPPIERSYQSIPLRLRLKWIRHLSLPLALIAIFLVCIPGSIESGTFTLAADQCPTRSGQITRTTISSTIYSQLIPVSIYLPPCYESSAQPLSVIYLLHGGGADETQWPDLRVQAEADALIAQGAQPFIVVMPGGDYEARIDYASFVLDDLLPAMNDQLSIRTDAAGRAIGGISLGGYWALSIAFHHPDQFAAVGGYSPVTASSSDNLTEFASKAAGLDRLRIQLNVGDADALAASTRQLVATLQARGLDISFSIGSGGHNRPYWRSHTGEYLRFMLSSFTAPFPRFMCHAES